MTIQEFFDQLWPEHIRFAVGDAVAYKLKRDGVWREGSIALLWAGIEPAVNIADGPTLFPTLGDEIRARGEGKG